MLLNYWLSTVLISLWQICQQHCHLNKILDVALLKHSLYFCLLQYKNYKLNKINIVLTLGVLQLYNANNVYCACCRKSLLFWSIDICITFSTALSAGACIENSNAVQYVFVKSSKNFSCAALVLIVGVCVASHIIL